MYFKTMRYHLLIVLVAVILTGCSNHVKVNGKVTFAEGGAPLTTGTVLLQNDAYLAKGAIQPDGTFTIGSLKADDGLPPGVYNVSITGAVKMPAGDSSGSSATIEELAKLPPMPMAVPEALIASKYSDPKTSGITFDTSKDKELNIVVETPKP